MHFPIFLWDGIRVGSEEGVCGDLVPHIAVLAHISGIANNDPHPCGMASWQESSKLSPKAHSHYLPPV